MTSIYGGMTLRHLIHELRAMPQDAIVKHGFDHPHSYRGYYQELAVSPTYSVTIGSMLDDLLYALGKTMTGWKGGDFVMHENVGVWLSFEGDTGEPITSSWVELIRLEANATNEAIPADPVTVIFELTFMIDEENDESLEAKLNDPHTAFDIPKGFVIDDVRVVEPDSPEVMGFGVVAMVDGEASKAASDTLAAALNSELVARIVEDFDEIQP